MSRVGALVALSLLLLATNTGQADAARGSAAGASSNGTISAEVSTTQNQSGRGQPTAPTTCSGWSPYYAGPGDTSQVSVTKVEDGVVYYPYVRTCTGADGVARPEVAWVPQVSVAELRDQ